jgi:hypothetical protein
MRVEDLTTADTIFLQKDSKGFVHVKLYRVGEGINVIDMSLRPDSKLSHVNSTVVFLKEKYIPLLKSTGIISDFFQSKDGPWCGFLDINVYFELENSHNRTYTRKLLR